MIAPSSPLPSPSLLWRWWWNRVTLWLKVTVESQEGTLQTKLCPWRNMLCLQVSLPRNQGGGHLSFLSLLCLVGFPPVLCFLEEGVTKTCRRNFQYLSKKKRNTAFTLQWQVKINCRKEQKVGGTTRAVPIKTFELLKLQEGSPETWRLWWCYSQFQPDACLWACPFFITFNI